jgi:hypothetical protein
VSNRYTLAQLREMSADQVSSLAIEHLVILLEDVAELKADAKRLDDLLNIGLALGFGRRAAEMRKASGKDTGTVSLHAGEFVVRADSPKKVEWDQAKLREAENTIKSWGEDPSQYITYTLSVPEGRYTAWPQAIRSVFEPARTVSTGRHSFKIEKSKGRVG